MSSPLKVGDTVTFWPRGKKSHEDHTTSGKILDVITESRKENNRTIKASVDEPRYLVQNDSTDKKRWLKPEMIKSDEA